MEFIPGMQEFFNIHESVSVKHHIKKLNNENHMVISIDAAKAFDKTQTHLGLKNKQTNKKKLCRKLPQRNLSAST